jgi:glycosyltransferase involved in cell wall biosynthesis
VLENRPLKIAAIGMRGIPSNYSGIERASESLYTRLAARGHQITVYCRPECLPTKIEYYRGVRLLRAPTLKRKSLDSVFHAFVSILHAAVVERYDLIHLHAAAAGLFAQIPRLKNVPSVVTIHGLDWQRAKWKGLGSAVLRAGEKSVMRHATEIIAVSRDLQDYFARQYGRQATYIPNGIDRTFPTGLENGLLESFRLEPGKFITYIGRLVPEKRIEDLILAFRQLRTAHKLAIVGEGGYTDDYVSELRNAAGDDPRIVFTGLQRGAALDTLYRGASAFASASDLEGLPMSLLEAIERGIPAVVSDIPPHRELLGSVRAYDLFFPRRDVGALAERMRRTLDGRDHYCEIASRAQTFVRKNYSWDASADATEKLFYQAVRDALRRNYRDLRCDAGVAKAKNCR